MVGSELCVFSFRWIVPIVMMILCLLMMRGRKRLITGGFGSCGRDRQQANGTASAMDILDKR